MEKASSEYPTSFRRLYKVREFLEPGSTYDGVTLLSGWLVTNTEGKGTDRTSTWIWREDEDVQQDDVQFAKDLMSAVENRVTSVTSDTFLTVLEIFDAQLLVRLQSGKKVGQEVRYHVSDGEYDEYGVNECKEVINVTHMTSFLNLYVFPKNTVTCMCFIVLICFIIFFQDYDNHFADATY